MIRVPLKYWAPICVELIWRRVPFSLVEGLSEIAVYVRMSERDHGYYDQMIWDMVAQRDGPPLFRIIRPGLIPNHLVGVQYSK